MQPEKLCDIASKINDLSCFMGCPFEEKNGQRIFGPPDNWLFDLPGLGTEVFITNMPPDIFEEVIIPLFGSVGYIYQVRLMRTTLGANRGYGYVRYGSPKDAQTAVAKFNGYNITINHKIGVKLSRDDNRVYVSGIPCHISPQVVYTTLMQEMYKAIDVKVQPRANDLCMNVGHAIVTFENHRDAALARNRAPWWIFNSQYGNLKFIWPWQKQNEVAIAGTSTERIPDKHMRRINMDKIRVLRAILNKNNYENATQCLEEICKTMNWQYPIYEETIINHASGHRWSTTITLPAVGSPLYGTKRIIGPFNAINHTKTPTRALAATKLLLEMEKSLKELEQS